MQWWGWLCDARAQATGRCGLIQRRKKRRVAGSAQPLSLYKTVLKHQNTSFLCVQSPYPGLNTCVYHTASNIDFVSSADYLYRYTDCCMPISRDAPNQSSPGTKPGNTYTYYVQHRIYEWQTNTRYNACQGTLGI